MALDKHDFELIIPPPNKRAPAKKEPAKRIRKSGLQYKKKPLTEITEAIEAEVIEPGEEEPVVGTVRTEPMLQLIVGEFLRGTSVNDMRDALAQAGYPCNKDKVYRLLKLAKLEVRKRARKDFDENYAWAQENLLQIHAQAQDTNDVKIQLVVIKQLIELWGLDVKDETPKETDITPEMIEQFETALLR